MNDESLVSVVVPTYESEEHLGACLASIAGQSYDPLEIIVVDNHSTDRTREIAGRFTDNVYTEGPERCAQLNFGFEKASGEYLYRVDSDFLLEPTVVEEAVERCENGTDAVYVHNTSDPTVSFWSRVRKFERDCYERDGLNVAARFFHRSVIDEVGGYDEGLVAGEDYDLHNRIVEAGYDVGPIDAREVHLGEPASLREVVTTHYSYGQSVGAFVDKNPVRGTKQLSPLRPAYVRNWRRFVGNPLLTVGFVLYQVFRYGAAGAGWASEKFPSTS